MKIILLAIFVLVMSGCGAKNQVVPETGSKNQNGELKYSSVEELLSLKYNRAVLRCELRLQNTFNLSALPNDSFMVDLKANQVFPMKLTLKAALPNHETQVTVELTSLDSHYLELTAFKKKYVAKNSPFVKLKADIKEKILISPGFTATSSEQTNREVDEKIIDNIYHVVESTTNPESTTDLFCILDSDIKAPYQNDFQIINL